MQRMSAALGCWRVRALLGRHSSLIWSVTPLQFLDAEKFLNRESLVPFPEDSYISVCLAAFHWHGALFPFAAV